MTFPEHAEYYHAGIRTETNGVNRYEGFVKAFGSVPIGGSPEWRSFLEGADTVSLQRQEEKRKAYRVDEFLAKLSVLCREYDAHIYSDYDGAMLSIKDYETCIRSVGPDSHEIT